MRDGRRRERVPAARGGVEDVAILARERIEARLHELPQRRRHVLPARRAPQLEALAAKLASLSGKFDTLAQLVLKGQQNGYCKAEIGELQGLAPSAQDIAATALKECMAKRFPDLTALGKLAIEEGVGFTGTPNFIEVKAVEDDPWKSRALIGTGALAGLGFGVGICYNQDNDSPSTEAIDCGSALAVSTVVGTLIGLGVDWVTD